MRSRTKVAAVAIAIGGLTAISAPAFAATGGDTPDPTAINFSVSVPETASLTIADQSINLVGSGIGANISAATAVPGFAFGTNGGKQYTGGDLISVESDSPAGYTLELNGSAGGLIPAGGGAAVDWFDLNLTTAQVASGANGGTPTTTDNHFVSAAGADPTTNGVQVLNATGPSGSITVARDNSGNNVTPVDTATGETPDTITTAYYINPRSGLIPGHSYAASANFTYLAK